MPYLKDKIVVIGAGLAGLTVAYRLSQKGYDVEVFEARNRVGGRVHSVLMKNLNGELSIAELGGQNITDGGNAAHLCSLAKELGIDIIRGSFKFTGTFFDGKKFHDRTSILLPLIQNKTFDKIESIQKSSGSMQEVLDKLITDASIQKRMLSYMLNAYEGLPPKLLSTQPHNLETLKCMMSGGLAHAHDIIQLDSEIVRGTLKGGNARLPLKLHEALKRRVFLKKILKNVTCNGKNEIILQFEDSTERKCNKLILAVPCSVFEEIAFDPEVINPERIVLIQGMQYGENGKIILPIQCEDSKNNWIFADNFGVFRNADRNLLTLYYLKNSDISLTDFKYFYDACAIIKQGFKNANVDESTPQVPDDIQFKIYSTPLIKSWKSDPYAKGSYSAYGVILGNKIDEKITYGGVECKNIFSPVNDRVFFVGEHTTILDEIGTMEAAVESGERIARMF